MADINSIRIDFFNKGLSISKIHQNTGYDHKTIRKYLNKEEFNVTPSIKQKRPGKLTPYHEIIDKWLLEDKQFRRKQRHTAKRVYDRLVEEFPGFDAKYRTVAAYYSARYAEIWSAKSFIPLSHPGGESQADFGASEYFENGQKIDGHHFVLSFPYSNAGFGLLYPGESAECLLEGLQQVFEHIGGVPRKIWFDNASSIVSKIKEDGERVCTELFLRFKNHYNFDVAFCNPSAGNEKGNVENKVGYIRRNMFVPAPEFLDVEAFNRQQLKRCEEDMQRQHYQKNKSISELFAEEKALLLPLPSTRFEVCRYVSAKADSCGRIRLDVDRVYSTSPSMAGSSVTVKITAHRIHILDAEMKDIVAHKRLYGNQHERMCWLPYLSQLSKKPGALKYTPVYAMLPQNLQECLKAVSKSDCGKILKTLSDLTKRHGFKSAMTAMSKAIEVGVTDSDSIIATFNRINSIDLNLKPVGLPDSIPEIPPVSSSAADYDSLLKGGSQ
mgnify:CR=1 FL=1